MKTTSSHKNYTITNKIHPHIDPFDFVEPCEPDCSPQRHAYHQGQWDMAARINKFWGLFPHPTEHMNCEKEQL